MLKKSILLTLAFIFLTSSVYGDYRYNPYTSRNDFFRGDGELDLIYLRKDSTNCPAAYEFYVGDSTDDRILLSEYDFGAAGHYPCLKFNSTGQPFGDYVGTMGDFLIVSHVNQAPVIAMSNADASNFSSLVFDETTGAILYLNSGGGTDPGFNVTGDLTTTYGVFTDNAGQAGGSGITTVAYFSPGPALLGKNQDNDGLKIYFRGRDDSGIFGAWADFAYLKSTFTDVSNTLETGSVSIGGLTAGAEADWATFSGSRVDITPDLYGGGDIIADENFRITGNYSLLWRNAVDDTTVAHMSYDGSLTIRTVTTGDIILDAGSNKIECYDGSIWTTADLVIDSDTGKLLLGTDQDSEIYHSGNLMVDCNEGDIYFFATGGQAIFSSLDIVVDGTVSGGTGSTFGTATDYWTFSELDFGAFGKIPLISATSTFALGATVGAIADYLIIYDNSASGVSTLAFAANGLAATASIVFDGSALTVNTDWLPAFDSTYNLGASGTDWKEAYIEQVYAGDIFVESNIYRTSDTDTYIYFSDDVIGLFTGSLQMADFQPTAITFNIDNQDCDFIVKDDNGNNALYMQGSDGNVGVGRIPVQDLDLLGKLRITSSVADDTAKYAYLLIQHYDTDDADVLGFLASSEAAQNKIIYGGGSAQFNCMTDIYFYTAADTSTVSGTSRMHIGPQGSVGIGTTASDTGHLYLYNASVSTTGTYYGEHNYHIKTLGATDYADNLMGFKNYVGFNQAAGEVGIFAGVHNTAILTSGSVGAVGNTKSMYGIFSTCQMDGGTVTSDAYGGYIFCDLNASGTVSGNAYGLYIDQDMDGTLTGNAYMLYLNQRSNIDYAIYHTGTAPSRLGGTLDIQTTTDPQFRLTHTDGVDECDFYLDGDSILWISPQASTGAVQIDHKLVQTGITVSAAGPTDNVDVSGCNIVWINTSANNVTIGGFVGGYDGQVIFVVMEDYTNNCTLEYNEGTGNQDIFLSAKIDETLTAKPGGWTLVCNGTSWYEVGSTTH